MRLCDHCDLLYQRVATVVLENPPHGNVYLCTQCRAKFPARHGYGAERRVGVAPEQADEAESGHAAVDQAWGS